MWEWTDQSLEQVTSWRVTVDVREKWWVWTRWHEWNRKEGIRFYFHNCAFLCEDLYLMLMGTISSFSSHPNSSFQIQTCAGTIGLRGVRENAICSPSLPGSPLFCVSQPFSQLRDHVIEFLLIDLRLGLLREWVFLLHTLFLSLSASYKLGTDLRQWSSNW